MKKLLILIFSTLLLVGCATSYKIDEKATANAPWKVGEVVYEDTMTMDFDDPTEVAYTRVFQGVTDKGYFLVQEFFANGRTKANPYFIIYEKSVTAKSPTIHGEMQTWYSDGEKDSECLYDHGKTLEPCTGWYRTGEKLLVGGMLDGFPHGKGTFWYRSGEKLIECILQRGTGFCVGWHKNGQKKITSTVKASELNGLLTEWYENGQKLMEATYQNGKLYGTLHAWYENGQKSMEAVYQDGKLHGLTHIWYENGQKKTEVLFKDGKIVDVLREWDEEGNLKPLPKNKEHKKE